MYNKLGALRHIALFSTVNQTVGHLVKAGVFLSRCDHGNCTQMQTKTTSVKLPGLYPGHDINAIHLDCNKWPMNERLLWESFQYCPFPTCLSANVFPGSFNLYSVKPNRKQTESINFSVLTLQTDWLWRKHSFVALGHFSDKSLWTFFFFFLPLPKL